MAWDDKANLRGPAGYNAFGAEQSIDTLADYAKQTAGPNKFADALNAIIAAARRTSQVPHREVRLADHGAKFDRRPAIMTTTAGSAVINSPDGAFTNADVGKLVFVPGAGTTAQPWNGALVANIMKVNTATQVVVSTAAAAAVSSVASYLGTNNESAWKSAHSELAPSAFSEGGGTLIMPAGHGMHTTQNTPLSYVRYQGAGRGISVMHPVASVNGFIRWGTAADPLIGTEFRDFTIDGDMQTNGSGAGSKGTGLYFMREVLFENMTVKNTAGSGFGNDFHQDCYYVRCRAEGNGRIGTTSSPGHSGFGFGSGGWKDEHVFLIECVSVNNMRHGCFLEWQPGITPNNQWQSNPGLTVVGGRFEYNGVSGISDQAAGNAIVTGAHIVNNLLDGYSVTTTPPQLELIGVGGTLADCVISGNGRHGVDIYYPDVPLPRLGRYRVMDNLIEENGEHGIHLRAHSRHIAADIEVSGNTGRRNRKNGLRIGGAFTRLRAVHNLFEDNGRGSDEAGAGLGGPDRNGIAVHGTIADSDISHNTCRDTRATGKSQLNGLLFTTAAPVSAMTGNSRIVGNELRGNGAAGISGYAQVQSGTIVRDNTGFQPIGVESVAPTGSPMTYTAGGMPEVHYLIGAVTSIALNGSTILTGPGVVYLEPWDSLVVSYSATPTSWKRRRI